MPNLFFDSNKINGLVKKVSKSGADTAQPGQGIGLAVAIDIISGYQGSLEVFNSSLGGAEFRLYLPY